MKKTVKHYLSFLALVLAILAVTVSCMTYPTDGAGTGDTEDPEGFESTEKPEISVKEAEARQRAEAALQAKFSILDFSEFDVVYREDGDNSSLWYHVLLYGMRTGEWYGVDLETGSVTDVRHIGSDIPASILASVTEKMAADTIARLDIQTAACRSGTRLSDSGYFLRKVSDGTLILCAEYIVAIDPPRRVSSTDPDDTGEIVEVGGCGVDHDHFFFSEKVTESADCR